jgi:FAD/FMN-containing dehydrogenase
MAGTLLLKTSRMRAVTVDPARKIARVEAGATWGDVVGPAGEHGLAALSGSSHDVGVVGYTLGGGLSWLLRSYGLGANSVAAIELVTADGRLVRADHENEPDLFWALRGGGGSFGVVTAIELVLYPLTHVYAGMLAFPQERAAEVLRAYREWTETVPDEVTSVGRLLNVPPLPDIPEFLRGRSFVVVESIDTRGEEIGAAQIAALRELGPEIDTMALIPVPELITLHMDPPGPVPGSGDHLLLNGVSEEAIDALVAAAGPDSGSPLLSVEIRHLGGAAGRRAERGGALDSIDAQFAMFAVGMVMSPEMGAAVEGGLAAVKATLRKWDAGREYLNFAEKRTDPSRLYGSGAYARLRKVKAQYDPSDVFRSNHQISPAS